jgi:hypothetical protein
LIPDELFFQTLVYNLVPRSKIVSRTLTLSQFTDYMVPVVFYSDHIDYLLRQPFFMARKLSPHRPELHDALEACWRGERRAVPFKDEQFGILSPEYENTRVAGRHGLSGLPIIGRPSDTWSGGLERLEQPYFAILGSSAAELRFAHALLSSHGALLCHGQLFHPNSVELAPGTEFLTGYDPVGMLALRKRSAPDFVADLIRIVRDRQSGFLLRFGQGWHLPEVLFDRPNAKVMIIYGDPLIGFLESLADVEPLITDTLNTVSLRSFPPTILVNKFMEYAQRFNAVKHKMTTMVINSKPKGKPPSWSWLTELDLDVEKPARVGRRSPDVVKPGDSTWIGDTLVRWRNWFAQAQTCLGTEARQHPDRRIWSRLAADLTILHKNRQLLIDLLIAGGVQDSILAVSATDAPDFAPSDPERAVRVAVAQMVPAGLGTRPVAPEAVTPETASDIGSTVAALSAEPNPDGDAHDSSAGRAVSGNGAQPADPLASGRIVNEQPEAAAPDASDLA